MPDITTVTNDDLDGCSDTSFLPSIFFIILFLLLSGVGSISSLALFCAFRGSLHYHLIPMSYSCRAMLQFWSHVSILCPPAIPFTCYCDLPRCFPCVVCLATIVPALLLPSVIHPGDTYVQFSLTRVGDM